MSWTDILETKEMDIEFLLDPYIPKGGVVLLHGKASTGKSPLIWNIGLSVAAGLPFLGLSTKQGTVLYLELDSPEVLVLPRLKLLSEYERGLPFYMESLYPGIDILRPTPSQVHRLRELAGELKPSLVLINTLRKTFTADANDSAVPSAVYQAFSSFFPSSSIMFIHHDRKAQKDKDEEMEDEDLSGSLAWKNDCAVALHLVKHGRESGVIRLDHTKSQVSERHAPLLLRLEEDGSHLGLLQEKQLSEVVSILRSFPPTTPANEKDRELAKILRCSERSARRYRTQAERVFPTDGER